jgi:hypothetical protein
MTAAMLVAEMVRIEKAALGFASRNGKSAVSGNAERPSPQSSHNMTEVERSQADLYEVFNEIARSEVFW